MDNELQTREMMDILVDWFETIEELELTETDRHKLQEVADSLAESRLSAMASGISPEDFDEWLQNQVLDHWSTLMESVEDVTDPIEAFYQFAKVGEQGLYFQMLKRCAPLTQTEFA